MFQKTIFTIALIGMSVGMLMTSPLAEAKKKSSYKLTTRVVLNGVSPALIAKLCKHYACYKTREYAKYYKASIYRDGHGSQIVSLRKLRGKWYFRDNKASHSERSYAKSWRRVKVNLATDTFTNGRRKFELESYYKTDETGPYKLVSSRTLKRACLRHRKCRRALKRYARKHARKMRYYPTRYKRSKKHTKKRKVRRVRR